MKAPTEGDQNVPVLVISSRSDNKETKEREVKEKKESSGFEGRKSERPLTFQTRIPRLFRYCARMSTVVIQLSLTIWTCGPPYTLATVR